MTDRYGRRIHDRAHNESRRHRGIACPATALAVDKIMVIQSANDHRQERQMRQAFLVTAGDDLVVAAAGRFASIDDALGAPVFAHRGMG